MFPELVTRALRIWLRIWVGAGACLVAAAAGGQPTTPADLATAAASLIVASGRDGLIGRVPGHLAGFLDRGGLKRAPSVDPAQLRRAFAGAFDADRLAAWTASAMASRWHPDHAAATAAFFASPFGEKVAHLRAALPHAERIAALKAYAASLESSPPRELLRRRSRLLDGLTGASETSVQIRYAAWLATGMAEASTLAADRRRTEIEIAAELAAGLPRLRVHTAAAMVTPMLYDHRFLSDDEISDYAAFAMSPEGVWFYKSFLESLSEALRLAALDVGERIR